MISRLDTAVLQTQRHLSNTEGLIGQVLRRISTGQKYQYLSDDSSAFVIGTGLDLNVKSLSAADETIQKATDLLNTADSYIQSIADNLSQMYELATKASDPLISADERASYSAAFEAKTTEINTLALGASYRGTKLLDGTFPATTIPVGFGNTISITLANFTTGIAPGLNIDVLTLDTAVNSATAATSLSTLINGTFSTRVNSIASQKSILSTTAETQNSLMETLKAAKSRILDANVNEEMTNLTTLQIRFNAGISVLAQVNSLRATAGLSLLGMK